jgi:hypothetical protein
MAGRVRGGGADNQPELDGGRGEHEFGGGLREGDQGVAARRRAALPLAKRKARIEAAARQARGHNGQAGGGAGHFQIDGHGIVICDIEQVRAPKEREFELEIDTVPKLRRLAGDYIVYGTHRRSVDREADSLAIYLHIGLMIGGN